MVGESSSGAPGSVEQRVWQALETVMDPEIPVISVVDLGLIRKVVVEDDRVAVTMTPTFAGCPALHVMEREIKARLSGLGFATVTVETTLSPAWSTDWLSDSAREKLHAYGIAPPPQHGGAVNLILMEAVPCPQCGSDQTTERNAFGPTACKAIYTCDNCLEPFERFKPV